jgi:hypothetical protein
MERDVLSDSIRSSNKGGAQQIPPGGAGTAPGPATTAAGTRPEIRWVGEQRLMEGYCGRAVTAGHATVADRAPARDAGPVSGTGGARAYSVRPVALLHRPRHAVVRIGPRPVADDGAVEHGAGCGETQARAA